MRIPVSRRGHDYRSMVVAQERCGVLSVAARHSGVGGDCRADWRSTGASFAFESGTAAIAFDVHLEDGGVVDEAIDDGEGHRRVGEDLAPFAEWLVGGDKQGSPLVPGADQSLVSA